MDVAVVARRGIALDVHGPARAALCCPDEAELLAVAGRGNKVELQQDLRAERQGPARVAAREVNARRLATYELCDRVAAVLHCVHEELHVACGRRCTSGRGWRILRKYNKRNTKNQQRKRFLV